MKKTSKKKLIFILSFLMTFTSMAMAYAGVSESVEDVENILDAISMRSYRTELAKDHNIVIKPYLKTRMDVTSNAFKKQNTHSDDSDVIWSWIPGFRFEHKGNYGMVGGAYEAVFKYFSQFSNQNTQDQAFRIFANLKTSDRTYLNISEKLVQQGSIAGAKEFENINFLDNTVRATLGYKSEGDVAYEFTYENYDHDFQEIIATRYSYNENRYDWMAYITLPKGRTLFGGFILGDVDFDSFDNRDTTYWEIPLGIRGELFNGVVGSAQIGLHRRDLHASDRNDLTHVVAKVALKKTFNFRKSHGHKEYTPILDGTGREIDPTSFEVGFSREPKESSFSTATTFDEKIFYVNAQHLHTSKFRSRVNAYFGNRDFEERVFVGTRVIVGGAVFITSPDQVKRSDQIFGVTTGFDYDLHRNLKIHADYSYSRRESNVGGLDYTDNTISLRTSIPL